MKSPTSSLSQTVLYIFGFLLLWEWLRPIQELADIGSMYIFILFIGLSFVLSFFAVKIVWKTIILLLYILWAIHFLYYGTLSVSELSWISLLWNEISSSVGSLLDQQWTEITNIFRTILFFILLWMMTYLIHYWLIIRKSILLFFLMSVLFVTILDTFSPYNGDWAIVRLFIMGFFLLGILRFNRLLQDENIRVDRKQYGFWVFPLVIVITVSSILGFAAPKFSSQWPDPVPYLISHSEKFTNNGSSGGKAKVGYDEDDTKLGGGFEEDDTLVFTAKTEAKHYWKIETKNYYSGRGWEEYSDAGPEVSFDRQQLSDLLTHADVNRSKLFQDNVEVHLLSQHVPYPNPAAEGAVFTSDKEQKFNLNENTNKITTTKLESYSVDYKMPIYNVDELKKVNDPTISMGLEMYLQIPDSFPERVKALTETLTNNKTNWYDQVKAVENYFDSPDFVYAREEIPYPEGDQDFVDQFLFDTKKGYCDHFSSSMVMMLRSIGIPAKWVKGYTEGKFVRTENGKSVYEITNNNAHSWVEVYFPNNGWVPFEPTKGFNNNNRFEYNNTSNGTTDTDTKEDEEPIEKPNQNTPKPESEQSNVQTESKKMAFIKNLKFTRMNVVFMIIIMAILFTVLFAYRRKWIGYIILLLFRRKSSAKTMENAYRILLQQLQRYGIKRKPQQTLREYARYVDEYFMTSDMGEITKVYERVVYKGEDSVENWKQVNHHWKKIIKKTIT